jgi:hypothetical protein
MNFSRLKLEKICVCCCAFFAAVMNMQYAHADKLLDFSLLSPPELSQRRIAAPQVSWVVNPQASGYCQLAQPKDGFVSRPEGCVFWQIQSQSCTIVTTGMTTHSQLGHLFVHCLQAQ